MELVRRVSQYWRSRIKSSCWIIPYRIVCILTFYHSYQIMIQLCFLFGQLVIVEMHPCPFILEEVNNPRVGHPGEHLVVPLILMEVGLVEGFQVVYGKDEIDLGGILGFRRGSNTLYFMFVLYLLM